MKKLNIKIIIASADARGAFGDARIYIITILMTHSAAPQH